MINLLFCGNDGVFDGILTCLLSILGRSDSKESYAVTVLTMDVRHLNPAYVPVTDAHAELLEKVLRTRNPDSSVRKVDVTSLYREAFAGCPNEGAYCSPYTLIRLFADKVDMPDRFLYLDADVLFNRDIRLLYDTGLDGYEYAAARDHYGKYLIHPRYINAGVVLFNMAECRRTGLFEKARKWIRTKKLVFADQSALIRSTAKKKMLPQRFNDQKYLHGHTVVRHFSKRLFWLPYPHTDNVKQWQVDRVHAVFHYHQFDDILNEYLDWKALSEGGLHDTV